MKNTEKILKLGTPEVMVVVNYSTRAKNYSIRISNIDSNVKLTIPRHGSYDEAVAFARAREPWIKEKLSQRLPDVSPQFGSEILFQGQNLIIRKSKDKRIYVDKDQLYVYGEADQLNEKLTAFLKSNARDQLDFVSKKYANTLGRTFNKLTLRDTRTRWGSCSSNGHLMYSWRLIMAPPNVLKYVSAHEVSHLIHLNHSSEFWKTVSYLMPDFEYHRDWLKKNGQSLHRYKL